MPKRLDTLTVITEIPFVIDIKKFLQHARIRENSPIRDEALRFAADAEHIGRPKGIYRLASVTVIDDMRVELDDVVFTSRLLNANLAATRRAFPYIATGGRELESWKEACDDPVKAFWADVLSEMSLHAAVSAIQSDIMTRYEPGTLAEMNPGSLEDWPIQEQEPFFRLFTGHTEKIGVALTDTFLMYPIKSVSGLWFPNEDGYANCRLCPREGCRSRQAAFDPEYFNHNVKTAWKRNPSQEEH